MKIATSRLTIKGQVTIPKEFRRHLNLNEGESVCFSLNEQNQVVLSRVNPRLTCPICDQGVLHGFHHEFAFNCPLCQGTEVLTYQSTSDWVKAAIDVASGLDLPYELYRTKEGYSLSFHLDGPPLKDQLVAEQYETFLQQQLKQSVQRRDSDGP